MFALRLKSNHQSFYKTTEFFSHLKSPFLLKKSHFQKLFKSKNGLFSHGQNILSWTIFFCRGQFKFCPKQKLFCLYRRTRQMIHFQKKWTQVTILTNLHRKPKKYAVSSIDNIVNFCLVLLHGQNNFCLGQNKFVLDKIILSEVKML